MYLFSAVIVSIGLIYISAPLSIIDWPQGNDQLIENSSSNPAPYVSGYVNER